MQGFFDVLRNLGPARLAAMGAVTLALVGFFIFLMVRISTPAMAPLFTGLTLEDSAQVVRELDRTNVPYELRRDGATIMVPQEQVTRVRMQLAGQSLPRGGGIGYEIFDRSDTLGATSFVQNVNHLRALEGELARTIRAIDRVEQARVHLVLPERPLFARERAEPSASIVVRVRGGLEAQQIRAIRHLVASAVQGLKPERVSIVDEGGRLLADGAQAAHGGGLGADERQLSLERRLREQIESIVGSVVGPGRARVNVTAEMDFNRITQTQDMFDPEGRVVRSTQTREEQSTSGETQGGAVTVGNELPGANQAQGGAGGARDQNRRSEEVVNFEISRTTRTEVVEGGRLRRVSVAVLVDGTYTRNNAGDVAYEPRSREELDRIAALVRSAIGFDQRRGDQVEIVNLRFAEQPSLALPPADDGLMGLLAFTRDDILRMVEIGTLLIVALLVLLFVVRPLLRRVLGPEPQAAAAAAGVGGGVAALAGPDGAGADGEPEEVPESETSKMIAIAQVQGQVHAQSIQKVGELVEQNPHETVAIIRQWLKDAA